MSEEIVLAALWRVPMKRADLNRAFGVPFVEGNGTATIQCVRRNTTSEIIAYTAPERLPIAEEDVSIDSGTDE